MTAKATAPPKTKKSKIIKKMLGRAAFDGSAVLFPGVELSAGEFMGGAAAGAAGGRLVLGEGRVPPGAAMAGKEPGATGPADGTGEGAAWSGNCWSDGRPVEEGEEKVQKGHWVVKLQGWAHWE